MKNLTSPKTKKALVTLGASLVLVGSLTATAVAAQGEEPVQKDVVMTESGAPASLAQLGESQSETPVPGIISEAQAKQIGKTALQEAYGPSASDGLKEYRHLDQGAGENPVWVIYWSSQDFKLGASGGYELNAQAPVKIYSVRIDAKTGEISGGVADKTFLPEQTK